MVIEPETPVTGWCRGCDTAATKSVHAVGGHGWIVIWFCPRHCEGPDRYGRARRGRVVQVKGDNGVWSTVRFCDHCYTRFVLDTDGDPDFEGNLKFEAAPPAAGNAGWRAGEKNERPPHAL